jgi:hypothetical protein
MLNRWRLLRQQALSVGAEWKAHNLHCDVNTHISLSQKNHGSFVSRNQSQQVTTRPSISAVLQHAVSRYHAYGSVLAFHDSKH